MGTRGRLARAAALLVLGTTCSFHVDPDQGHFSCGSDKDCGSGFQCVQQANGSGGLCFRIGLCTPEVCNGKDDDCDGVIDNGFNLLTDDNNCGGCGHLCAAGTGCDGGACLETNCEDGLDNDGNGLTDCADPNCPGRACSAADAGWICGTAWVPIPMDAGPAADGGVDAGQDAGVSDAGADGGTADSGASDAGVDAGGFDSGVDAGPFVDGGDADGGTDAGVDAGVDAGIDGGYILVPACVP